MISDGNPDDAHVTCVRCGNVVYDDPGIPFEGDISGRRPQLPVAGRPRGIFRGQTYGDQMSGPVKER